MDSGVTLTYEDRRVVDDWRFSVVRPYLREWNLQIRDVQWPDQDMYRCTINTTPVKSKIVSLHVKGRYDSVILAACSYSALALVGLDLSPVKV